LRAVPVPLRTEQPGSGAGDDPRGGVVVPGPAGGGRHARGGGHGPRDRVVSQRPVARLQGRLRRGPAAEGTVPARGGRAARRRVRRVGDGGAGGRRRPRRGGEGGGRPPGGG